MLNNVDVDAAYSGNIKASYTQTYIVMNFDINGFHWSTLSASAVGVHGLLNVLN